MRLKINGETVDYTLGKESVLSEVVSGVEDWLGGSGFLITGIHMGDRNLLDAPGGEWEALPIDSVAELDFIADHMENVRIEHWVTIRSWLGMLAEDVKGEGASLAELLKDLPMTIDGMKKNPFSPRGSDSLERLAALFADQTPETVRQWPAERKREACELLGAMRAGLAKRIRDTAHPKQTVKSRIGEIRGLIDKLGEVPVLLQTGKDRQAMEIVIGFSELFQGLIDIVPFLEKDAERERIFEELNAVLRELISAFDAKDLVLIGDLFEYEVAPRLGRLVPVLEKCL